MNYINKYEIFKNIYILEAFESTDEIKITKADNEILTAIAVNLKTLSKDSKDDSIFKDDEIKPYVKEAIIIQKGML